MMENNSLQIKIGLCGATGRTSQSIIKKAQRLGNQFKITSKFSSSRKKEELPDFCNDADVIIDFSNPAILPELLKQCVALNKPLVIGTTSLSDEHKRYLHESSHKIPIVYSANMTQGVNLIADLIAKCLSALGEQYDTEIIEYHHRYKKDAPSGTAIMLGQEIAKAKGLNFDDNAVLSRSSKNLRKSNEIGISSVRGGGIKGEHEVIFASDNEIIKLSHQVISRDTYADGALKAALWVTGKKPGLYSMRDVLTS